MTQLTEHAKTILRAIADGKQIEVEKDEHWIRLSVENALHWIAQTDDAQLIRIAPQTRSINGVTFAAPVKQSSATVGLYLGRRGYEPIDYDFATLDGREMALNAIIDALEGRMK